ncbi:MAG: hypothetical protein LQ349_009084 [Xanthoria aureola]|nr:MAG: hypothetical protein LQ349_009084 [Xanthoria aureola]
MPQIVLLRLGDEMQTSIFDDLYQPLCDDISQKYSTIQTKSAADVRPLLSDPSLQAILVVDGGLTKGKKHIALQKQLSSYAHAGAIELEREYSMKAVHLKNTPADSRVYVPLEQSRTESRVFPPTAVDQEQTPAAFSQYGSGWIGYIGDVNNEEGSRSLLMALLDLATSTDTSAASKGRSSNSSSTITTSPIIGCSICGQLTPMMKCGRCHTTRYCSTDCQKADWKEHKIYCGKPSLEPA